MTHHKLIQGDCLQAMKNIPDNSIDLIITSPPYNLGNVHHTGNKHHSSYDDNLPEQEYQTLQIKILNECERILKLKGSMIYNHKNRIRGGLQITPYEWLLKTNFLIKQEIVWVNGSQNFDKIRFYPFTERLYWLVKNKETKLFNSLNKTDVLKYEPEGTAKKHTQIHQHTRAYPLDLIVDLIKMFPDNKVILDPFAGSGTTMQACVNTKRNSINIEISEKYCNLIKERCFGQQSLFEKNDFEFEVFEVSK